MESGVVFEEWRLRQIAERRLSNQCNQLLLEGSPYADEQHSALVQSIDASM